MASQPARVGDIVTEMSCKCGTILVQASKVAGYRCERGHATTKGYRWRIDADGMTRLASWDQT
jgi:hypothetical protein